jgi:hypothetical protein
VQILRFCGNNIASLTERRSIFESAKPFQLHAARLFDMRCYVRNRTEPAVRPSARPGWNLNRDSNF